MRIGVFVGTRPEIIKMQPVIAEILRKRKLELILTHAGQHYDDCMSDVLIKELGLPDPHYFLNARSGSQGVQTAKIIMRSEKVIRNTGPDVVLVQGDTNSALGAALAASKLKVPVGHVEAGCRSFDKQMPEEINRVLIADISSLHFAPTETCVRNLLREGVLKEKIYLTGHPLVDLLERIQKWTHEDMLDRFALKKKEYYLVTLHREINVDNEDTLKTMLETLSLLACSRSVIFPIHPRTAKSVSRFRLKEYLRDLVVVDPVGYLEALSLIKYAKIVLTDSGGIQQEACLLGTPCVTLRDNTEWVETVKCKVNFLAGKDKDRIISTVKKVEKDMDKIHRNFVATSDVFGKNGVSKRIINILENCKL